MKILVTGGTGFTGSHLVRRLLSKGHQVRVLDFQGGLFHKELRERGAEIRLGSVTDAALVDEMVKGCEVVYHVAAAFRQLNVSREHYWEVNVTGTLNVAAAAHRHGARKLVYCSTCGIHGHITSLPGNEESPIAPEDYYQYTKYEGETVVQKYVDQGLDAVILRPAAIYGPGDAGRFLMLFRLAKRGRFLMFGNGNTYYHPVHIDNLIDAFELAASQEGIRGRAYLIADDRYWTLDELVEQVGQALGVRVRIRHLPFGPLWLSACACELVCKPLRITPPLFRRRVNWFRHDRAFSIDKARKELGYEPRVRLAEGLTEAARWYRSNNYL
jgi:nucleoside-diphosphate-sugar epimerase